MRAFRRLLLTLVLAVALVAALAAPAAAVTEEEIQASIDSGLAWLATQQMPDGSWGWELGATGLAVVKFEDYAYEHGFSPFDPAYVYYDQVTKGLDFLLRWATASPVGGIYFAFGPGWHETYGTGITLMALSASREPDREVGALGSHVDGWTYAEVVRAGVAYFAAAQNPDGGWRYWANPEPSDNSNSGYAVLGLRYAEVFGATIPDTLKARLSAWVDYMQNDVDGDPLDGGSGYVDPWGWVNLLKTGNLLFEMSFVGDGAGSTRAQDALDYIERWWNDPSVDPGWQGWPGGYPHLQAAYCLMKGLESLGVDMLDLDGDGVPDTDWYDVLATAIVGAQQPDGSWPWDYWGDAVLATSWALLTLERVVPPLEIAIDIKPGSYPNSINAGKNGVIPVAILTSDEFDASTVDPATILFGPAGRDGVAPLRWACEDVDWDGDMDLILHFDAPACGFAMGDTEGVLTAETFEGRELVGSDSVRIVPAK